MINIFAYTNSNRSGVDEIDHPDRFGQIYDAYYIHGAYLLKLFCK